MKYIALQKWRNFMRIVWRDLTSQIHPWQWGPIKFPCALMKGLARDHGCLGTSTRSGLCCCSEFVGPKYQLSKTFWSFRGMRKKFIHINSPDWCALLHSGQPDCKKVWVLDQFFHVLGFAWLILDIMISIILYLAICISMKIDQAKFHPTTTTFQRKTNKSSYISSTHIPGTFLRHSWLISFVVPSSTFSPSSPPLPPLMPICPKDAVPPWPL